MYKQTKEARHLNALSIRTFAHQQQTSTVQMHAPELSDFDTNVWGEDTRHMSTDESESDTASSGHLSEQTLPPPPPPRRKIASPPSEDVEHLPWYQRKSTLVALLAVLLVALIGSACGFIIGSKIPNSPTRTTDPNDFSESAAVHHVTGDSDDESSSSSESSDDDHRVDYLPPADAYLASVSCIDDPTWRVIQLAEEGKDRQGGTSGNNSGCAWVATDISLFCQRQGVSSLMAFNRAGSGGGTKLIVEAATACQLTCGSCDGSHAVEVLYENLGSIPEHTESALESVPLAAAPTKVPSSSSPTLHSTSSPVQRPTSFAPTPRPSRKPTTSSPTTTPTRMPTSPAPTRVPTLMPSPAPTARPTLWPSPEPSVGPKGAGQCASTARRNAYNEKLLPFQRAVEVGNVDGTKVGEASGLVASTKHPGILWTHNDRLSRQPKKRNKMYALDATSGDIVADFILDGAHNVDWEDMAYHKGFVYVGDVGDNYQTRRGITIYRVPEPDALDVTIRSQKRIQDWDRLDLRFPGGDAHNVEAFLLDPISERFVLLTKQGDRIYTTPRVWGLGDEDMTLQRAGFVREVPGDALVGADISPDGTKILLKYYDEIRYYCRDVGVSLEETLSRHYPVALEYDPEPKGESVAWSKDGFYTLSEAKMEATVPLYFYPRNEHN